MDKKLKFPSFWKAVVFSLYEPLYADTGGHCKWTVEKSVNEAIATCAAMPPGYVRRFYFTSYTGLLKHMETEKDSRVLKAAESIRYTLQRRAEKGGEIDSPV